MRCLKSLKTIDYGQERKRFCSKSHKFVWQRRMLSSIKGWEIVKYNNYSNGHTNPQSVKKLRIALSGREVIEYVLNDEDDTIKKLDNYFGLL